MITGLLIWRTAVRGQRIIAKDPLKEMGILRPRPLECFLLLNMFHVCGPILSLNAFAAISGIYMDNNDEEKANFWIKVHYIVWSSFCWVIITALVYFGGKLTDIILKHIKDTKEAGRAKPMKVRSLEQGLKKLRWILGVIVGVLVFFAIASLIFGLFRDFVLTYSSFLSHALAASWILIGESALYFKRDNKEPVQILPHSNVSHGDIPVQPYNGDYTSSKTDEVESYPMRPVKLEATRFTSSNDDSKISELSYQQSQTEYWSRNSSPDDPRTVQPITPASVLTHNSEPSLPK
ncbi:1461_t:CDS:2 [Acaulospora colombiana]|uniref:1461_t:CDS:1 n=1 Tax=Acaulospora colombiana TaxID=27376 RepID=A0ACA9KZE8_9GLOM|nr:1461_t:CDS:2 [Acaulospora colombiana]